MPRANGRAGSGRTLSFQEREERAGGGGDVGEMSALPESGRCKLPER